MANTQLSKKIRLTLSLLLTAAMLSGTLAHISVSSEAANAISSNDIPSDDISSDPYSFSDEDELLAEDSMADPAVQPPATDADPIGNAAAYADETVTDVVSDQPPVNNTDSESDTDPSALPDSDSAPEIGSDDSLPNAFLDEETFTLTFDFNGGTDPAGNTTYVVQAEKDAPLSQYIEDAVNKNFISPYVFSNKWDVYYTDSGDLYLQNMKVTTTRTVKANYTLKAIWSTKYRQFDINYQLNGGSYDQDSNEDIFYTYTYEDTVTLPKSLIRKN